MKKSVFAAITIACVASAVTSCIDSKYDLNNISTEITVGADGVTLPLGKIKTVTLDSLLGDASEVVSDANGDMSIVYDSTMNFTVDAVNVDQIKNTILPTMDPTEVSLADNNVALPEYFIMPSRSTSFNITVPSFSLDTSKVPDVKGGSGISDSSSSTFAPGENYTLNDLSSSMVMNYTIPEVSKSIKKIGLVRFTKPSSGGNTVWKFDISSASAYISKVRLNLTLTLSEQYRLSLVDNLGGKATLSGPNNNILTITGYEPSSLKFAYYFNVESFDMSSAEITESATSNSFKSKYSQSTQLNIIGICKGSTGISYQYNSDLNTDLTFEDADIQTDNVAITPEPYTYNLQYLFSGISPDVQKVNKVVFKSGTYLHIGLGNLSLPFTGWTNSAVEVELPSEFIVDSAGLPSGTTLSGHTMTTTVKALNAGISVPLNGIDFGTAGKVVSNEAITVTEPVKITVKPILPSGTYTYSALSSATGTKKMTADFAESKLYIDITNSTLTLNAVSSDAEFSEKVNYTINVPKELASVAELDVKDATGQDITVRIGIIADNSPVSKIVLNGFKVKLPQCLWVESDYIDADNVLTIPDRTVDVVSGQTIPLVEFKLRGLKNLKVENNKITIDDSIVLRGKAGVLAGTLLKAADKVKITPKVMLPDLNVTSFKGLLNLNLADYVENQSIDLSDITKELGNNDITLDMISPSIKLYVNNPIGVSVKGAVHITARDAVGAVMTKIDVPEVLFNGAKYNTNGITKLYITELNAAPLGYTLVHVDNLSQLLEKIPSRLDISVTGGADATTLCEMDLGRDFNFGLGYSLEIPLGFQGGTDINYSNTIDDVNDAFSDFADEKIKAETLSVNIEATSTLPVEAAVDMQFVDAAGVPVPGITTSVAGSVAGYYLGLSRGENTVSNVKIAVKVANGDLSLLKQVYGLKYTIKGTTGGNVVRLNKAQGISAVLTLAADKGITFDPSNM